MSEKLTIIVSVMTALTMLCGFIGLMVRYALLPWLREHLVKPVEQTRHQVTVNRHSSPEPTIPDRIDDIMRGIETVNERFDEHIDWSHEEVRRIWHAIITGRIPPPT